MGQAPATPEAGRAQKVPFRRGRWPRPQGWAFSLVETVLSIFLLLVGGLACLELVAIATRHQAQSSLEVQASRAAEQCLLGVQRWASSPANFYGSWAIYKNDPVDDPTGSGLSIRIYSSDRQAIGSPGGAMESPRADRRYLDQASVAVKVTVSWGRGQKVTLVRKFTAPRSSVHATNPLRVRRIGGAGDPVPRDAVVQMVCGLYDVNDKEIPGVCYSWVTEPLSDASHPTPGNGWLESPRQSLGREVQLFHHFYSADPPLNIPPHAIPGSLRLRAQAVYAGVPYAGYSNVVELAP